MIRRLLRILALSSIFIIPSVAQADLLSVWVAGKGNSISGTGGVFDNMDGAFAGGVEAGIEVLGMELMVEGFALGADQYMFTGNFGFDVGLDLGVRISAGAYVGMIGFVMPEPEDSGINIPADIRTQLGGDMVADAIEGAYNDAYGSQASAAEKYAGGVQARLRLQLDYAVVPFVYLGAEGSVGYHFMLSGSDVTAAAKEGALDEALKDQPITDEVKADLKRAVGAETPDSSDLSGTNYNVGVYIKLEF